MTEHTTHFDDCGCNSARLEAERDAALLRVASLEAALRAAIPNLSVQEPQAYRDAEAALSGSTDHLRALIVGAVVDGYGEGWSAGSRRLASTPDSLKSMAEDIADRLLGGGK